MIAARSAPEVAAVRAADRTPEARGVARDRVRLLASSATGDADRSFADLPELLEPGDLLVVNESATLAASLPAEGPFGRFRLHLSTRYGPDLWLAEPRWSGARPGPLPIPDGLRFRVAGVRATAVARFPGIPRLAFLRFDGDLEAAMARDGAPIRYGYFAEDAPLAAYQTVFATVPGSAEMPSAARPFTPRLVRRLVRRGIRFARVVLHAGVSSLEDGDDVTGAPPILPEPFEVPEATCRAIREVRGSCGRVIAVGTTVVRALESAFHGGEVRPSRGFTRRYVSPAQPVRSVDGLVTGWHAAGTTHLALLRGLAGEGIVRRSYARARELGYLWHEFGDSQLLLPGSGRPARGAGAYFALERPARARSAW